MRKRVTRTSYHQMTEGAWEKVTKRGHRNRCCFCAAEHVYLYRVDAEGGIEFRARLIKPGRHGRIGRKS